MDFSWINAMRMVAFLAILVILIWFIYSSQICMGIFFVGISIVGLVFGARYMESQFSPESP